MCPVHTHSQSQKGSSEFAGYLQTVEPSQLVQDSLVLVGHQMKKADVAVDEHYRATKALTINPSELQQPAFTAPPGM